MESSADPCSNVTVWSFRGRGNSDKIGRFKERFHVGRNGRDGLLCGKDIETEAILAAWSLMRFSHDFGDMVKD